MFRSRKRILTGLIVAALLIAALFRCAGAGTSGAGTDAESAGTDAIAKAAAVWFSAEDTAGDWDSSNASVITLNGDSADISGIGASTRDGDVVIQSAGDYVLKGTLNDGNVRVDADSSSTVRILMDGVDITCADDACIRVEQAAKVILTLAAGSENTLQSGAEYSETALADKTDGTIFAHDDLTINGSGALTVSASYKHGIAANDRLVIAGGTISVSAPKDGVRANDSISICGASLTVNAQDDGLVVAVDTPVLADSACAAEGETGVLCIASGTLTINAADDAVHTTGDILITGGELSIEAGDDALHSDAAFAFSGGTLLVQECYEGIEALTIDVSGGDITLYPQDDGFNANGGSGDMFGFGGGGGRREMSDDGYTGMAAFPGGGDRQMPDGGSTGMAAFPGGGDGQMPDGGSTADASADSSAGTDEETWISISGGNITIINETGQDADGLDSNGDIYISGGNILISLLGTGSNCAVDYGSESGGTAEISGGTLIACGAASMAEGFDSSSTQASFMYNISTAAEAGSGLVLKDAEGNVLLSQEIPCSFTSAILSCPELEVGQTYTLTIGGNEEEITLEEISASYGDTASSMFGGNHFGGGHGRMNNGQNSEGSQSGSTGR